MTDLLETFERDCAAAGVTPTAALKAGGMHPSTWFRWKNGSVSPTLRSFEAARAGLRSLAGASGSDHAAAPADARLAKSGGVQ